MVRIESSIQVPVPVQDVFTFLSRCESHQRFIPRMTELHQTPAGSFAAGTKLSGMLNYFGMRIPVQYEIIELKSNRALTMNGQMGSIRFQDGYILSTAEPASRIKFWLELYPPRPARVVSPLLGVIGKIHAWETLRNLKRELLKAEMASSSLRSPSE